MPNTPEHWAALSASAQRIDTISSERLLNDNARNQGLRHSLAGCHFDFTRQRVDGQILNELHELAQRMNLSAKRDAMFSGDKINTSENRGVLHSALRDGAPKAPSQYRQAVAQTKQRLFTAVDDIRSGNWRGFTNKAIKDVVHIGIGGSHLGPELITEALCDITVASPKIHFVANIDGFDLVTTLRLLNPATTLFIVASKSFSTLETRENARSARNWFFNARGCVSRAHNWPAAELLAEFFTSGCPQLSFKLRHVPSAMLPCRHVRSTKWEHTMLYRCLCPVIDQLSTIIIAL